MSQDFYELFSKRVPAILEQEGHVPQLLSVGWGEPAVIYTSCSCGWRGSVIEAYVEPDSLIEPYRTFVQEHGMEVTLAQNELFGTRASAQREILEHLALPLDYLIALTHQRFQEFLPKLQHTTAWPEEISAETQQALADLDLLTKLREFRAAEPLPSRQKPFEAELYLRYLSLGSEV